MTLDYIKAEVADIEAHRVDDETAHGLEDSLHQAVLLAIAEGRCADPAACAKAALRTQEIDFARWLA